MILRNYTPFVPVHFEARNVEERTFGVLVLRGTFHVVPEEALRPTPKQSRIVVADIWHGEPNFSSVYMESDLAPFKPRADVVVNAVAHAPGGRPLPEWNVQLRVGTLEKRLRVTGPRRWKKTGSGWELQEPEPTLTVPIRYEYAYGGMWKSNWGETRYYDQNPIGVGYYGTEEPLVGSVPAPQIESPDDPILKFEKAYRPEGLSPLGRAWQPRAKLAGTFDEEWKRTRWPELPLDFDFAYYNGAPPDLIAPSHFVGDEELEWWGLSAEGRVRCYLPGYQVFALLRFRDGSMSAASLQLDTIHLDLQSARVFLVWRALVPTNQSLKALEARMTQPGRG